MLTSLFGVQLHNHSFLDRHIDIFTFRQGQDFARNGIAVQFQPVRRSTAANEFERAGDLDILLHLFFDTDLVADHDLEFQGDARRALSV